MKKYETTKVKIKGETFISNIASKTEFMELFHGLKNITRSDDGCYWVIEEQEYDALWCVPTSEFDLTTETIELTGIGTAVVFHNAINGNGVCVINTTPHPISMQDMEGNVVTVPTTVLINAQAQEKVVDELCVTTEFVGTLEGRGIINDIKGTYLGTGRTERLVIVGSIIAAQAYKGDVVAMTPVPGYERVAPTEKRMNCNKFTVFC